MINFLLTILGACLQAGHGHTTTPEDATPREQLDLMSEARKIRPEQTKDLSFIKKFHFLVLDDVGTIKLPKNDDCFLVWIYKMGHGNLDLRKLMKMSATAHRGWRTNIPDPFDKKYIYDAVHYATDGSPDWRFRIDEKRGLASIMTVRNAKFHCLGWLEGFVFSAHPVDLSQFTSEDGAVNP